MSKWIRGFYVGVSTSWIIFLAGLVYGFVEVGKKDRTPKRGGTRYYDYSTKKKEG